MSFEESYELPVTNVLQVKEEKRASFNARMKIPFPFQEGVLLSRQLLKVREEKVTWSESMCDPASI